MKVWIVNPFDNLPQEGRRAQRYYLMARAFAAAGHEVVLWTSDFSHSGKCRRAAPDGSPLPARFTADGFEVRPIPTLPYSRNVSLRRLLSHFLFAVRWWQAGRDDPIAPVRLIISSSPPLTQCAAAMRLGRRLGAKVIVDIQDAWPETFARILPKWLLAPLKFLARRNYRRADAITAVADRYLELARSYGATCPMRRFYLGIGVEYCQCENVANCQIQCCRSTSRTSREPKTGERFSDCVNLVYAGSLGRTYDLAPVVSAVAAHPGWTLHIAGSGEQEAAMRRAVRTVFHGYLGEKELEELLAKCDIGVVPMSSDSFVGVPNKFADYARAGLAIASSLGGESAALLEHYGAGATYREGDADSFAAAVSSLLARLPSAKAGALELCRREFDAERIYRDYVASQLSALDRTAVDDI